jgi:DNA-binding transcriptional ArsR family regulator
MDIDDATRALSALSQRTRLETFRLLVRCGDDGLPAGEIARALETPHNTLSSHLTILATAGLVRSRREGRSIIYSIDFPGVRDLMSFLMEDCCQGRPEVCGPALDSVVAACFGEKSQRRTQ